MVLKFQFNYLFYFCSRCYERGGCYGPFGCLCRESTDCIMNDGTFGIEENNDENCPGENGFDGRPGRD